MADIKSAREIAMEKLAEIEELLKFFQYPNCGTPQEMAETIYKTRALLN